MKEDRKKGILYDLTCMWNLRNKMKTLLDTKKKQGGSQRGGGGRLGKYLKQSKGYTLQGTKRISQGMQYTA